MNHTPAKYDSLGFFNLIRGLGLLVIIAGHSAALFWPLPEDTPTFTLFAGAGRVLGGGIMAMYFLISGFYFYRRSPKKCLRIQAKLLLRPYFLTCFAIFTYKLFASLIKGTPFLRYGTGLLVTYAFGLNAVNGETLFGIPLLNVSIFWFMLALFGGWVLYNLILYLPTRNARIGCIAACCVASWILSQISRTWPASLPAALLATGYIAVGYEIRNKNLLSKKLPRSVWSIIGLTALISLAFGYVDISAGVWKLGLVDMAGSFCTGFLLMRIYAKRMARGCNGSFAKQMEQVGVYSIWIFCLHAFEKEVIPWRQLSAVFPGQHGLCILVCFVGRSIVIALLLVLVLRLNKMFRRQYRTRFTITDK